VMEQIVTFGEVRRGQLGIMIQDLTPDLAQAMDLHDQQKGAVIANIAPGSAAEGAGLKVGDVIIELGKAPIRGSADLRNKIGLLRNGDVAELTILRNGKSMTVRATLTAPTNKLIKGSEINRLLSGAVFGLAGPAASTSGVEVVSVEAESKAFVAGLRKGDIITSVNQEPVSGLDEFAARAKESGKRMLVNLVRNGSASFVLLQ